MALSVLINGVRSCGLISGQAKQLYPGRGVQWYAWILSSGICWHKQCEWFEQQTSL